ncbi:MAG: hypothetical protein IKQ36_08865 [Clostridia bacterium]|jgi:hypothetical protein|nr:hypothetical protein [Clostridia bacterium]
MVVNGFLVSRFAMSIYASEKSFSDMVRSRAEAPQPGLSAPDISLSYSIADFNRADKKTGAVETRACREAFDQESWLRRPA